MKRYFLLGLCLCWGLGTAPIQRVAPEAVNHHWRSGLVPTQQCFPPNEEGWLPPPKSPAGYPRETPIPEATDPTGTFPPDCERFLALYRPLLLGRHLDEVVQHLPAYRLLRAGESPAARATHAPLLWLRVDGELVIQQLGCAP